MIESRWGLNPLTIRDANANNLAEVLETRRMPINRAPRFNVPNGPFGAPCALPVFLPDKWLALRELALSVGFPTF